MTPRKKTYEIVADELRRMIETGRYRPGEKLRAIDELAAEYNVGRSTVREALCLLKALGLVESRQGGGTYVRRSGLDPHAMPEMPRLAGADLSRMLEVRSLLEVGAAELAARHRTAEDIGKLGRIIEEMRESAVSGEINGNCDAEFHLAIAHAAGNAMLAAMIGHVLNAVTECRGLPGCGGGSSATAGQRLKDHAKLFEAIRDGDAKRAAAAMARLMDRDMG